MHQHRSFAFLIPALSFAALSACNNRDAADTPPAVDAPASAASGVVGQQQQDTDGAPTAATTPQPDKGPI